MQTFIMVRFFSILSFRTFCCNLTRVTSKEERLYEGHVRVQHLIDDKALQLDRPASYTCKSKFTTIITNYLANINSSV